MIIFCNIYKAVNLRIDCFFYRRNKKGRNPSPTKVAISTRPLRQYYDTENYQNCIFFIILVMIFLCFWINEYSMMAESTWNIQVVGRYP